VAVQSSGALSFFLTDALGSITALSNSSGALIQTYSFDSFGIQTDSSGSMANPSRYTGREFDNETGVYYNRARYYSPERGRFLSEDPLRVVFRRNRYRYVMNNPIMLSDPSGMVERCTFTGESRITPWVTTATTKPISGWVFQTSIAEEPDKDRGLIPTTSLTCVWERKVAKIFWGNALFLVSYQCTDQLPCGKNITWTKHRIESRQNFERQTVTYERRSSNSFPVLGATDEVYDFECVSDPNFLPY